jgi:hypothetical protein
MKGHRRGEMAIAKVLRMSERIGTR